MKYPVRQITALILMLVTTFLATSIKPTKKLADYQDKVNLELMIPKNFKGWSEQKVNSASIVNPQQKETLDTIYSQTLSRVYKNGDDVIMLSIAYGENQSDATSLHYPEVCYPSQGYRVKSIQNYDFNSIFGRLEVKRLIAERQVADEFITYWTTLGSNVVRGKTLTKVQQIKYGLKGYVPDGMLFRVSSVGGDAGKQFSSQERFVNDLLTAMPITYRSRFIGDNH